MANTKFTLSYDGREFFGWQRHKDKPTIQGVLERELADIVGGSPLIHGSGRTDRGAHAEGQVFSVQLGEEVDLAALHGELNDRLEPEIFILEIESVPEDFHARASAIAKTYRYEIHNAPECPADLQGRVWHIPGDLDVDAMRAACPHFVGKRDFASVATRPNFKQKSTTRDLQRVDLLHEGPRISLEMDADGFLYKMVRNIVRAIVKVGEGRKPADSIPAMLAALDRSAAPGTAPASGLYLDAVRYAESPL